ncbi:Hypothetical predicted protein [Prunus dulcis]|uniref:Uncharacterized protein n=1 Tax=Prunus dulcis TaxID=3755 RepID=A0A5E4GEM3_PRUDU|nr:Hypothetical predicted protein [Prunus dulcis]
MEAASKKHFFLFVWGGCSHMRELVELFGSKSRKMLGLRSHDKYFAYVIFYLHDSILNITILDGLTYEVGMPSLDRLGGPLQVGPLFFPFVPGSKLKCPEKVAESIKNSRWLIYFWCRSTMHSVPMKVRTLGVCSIEDDEQNPTNSVDGGHWNFQNSAPKTGT